MGKLHLVVNMETSPRFLVAFVLLLAIASASGLTRSDDVKCDPRPRKGIKNACDAKENQHCEDSDHDGNWNCRCNSGFMRDADYHCVPSACSFDEENDGEYRTIQGKCFFFHTKSKRDFMEASAECKKKFGGNGRLYEPRTEAESTDLASAARSVQSAVLGGSENTWIGIRTFNGKSSAAAQGDKREWYYLSQGPQKNKEDNLGFDNGWAPAEPNDFDGQQDCVSILMNNNLGWSDEGCDLQGYSICESNVEVPTVKPPTTEKPECKDTDPAKKCKKCNAKKCKSNKSCKTKCKKTCKLC